MREVNLGSFITRKTQLAHKRHDGSDGTIYKDSENVKEVGERTSQSRNGKLKAVRYDAMGVSKI